MSTDDREDRATGAEIRALFEDVHRAEPPPPHFRTLWPGRRAPAAHAPRRRRQLLRFGVPAALAGALALALVAGMLQQRSVRETGTAPVPDLIATATSWHGPLDFLLRTPGYDLLESVPGTSLAGGASALPRLEEILKENSP